MIALDVNGAPIDTTMLMEHLQTAGELEAAGGAHTFRPCRTEYRGSPTSSITHASSRENPSCGN